MAGGLWPAIATAIFCLYGSPPIQSMLTWPPPGYVLLNLLMRFTTTCCADDGCVIVQIVMASPPDPPEPPPPQAAKLVAATRAAAAVASICLERSLLRMLFPCYLSPGPCYRVRVRRIRGSWRSRC